MTTIPIASVRIDGGTQSRAALNDEAVADYAAIIRDGTDFPPVIVFHDGKHYWLADGFHRWHAYRQTGAVEIAAEVRKGTKRDAVLFSVGANTDHGLRRTNADKRCAVMVLLGDEEWSKWSDREIAKRCGVSDRFVNGLRGDTANGSQYGRTFIHPKTGHPATMDTSKIGKPADVQDVVAEARRVKEEQRAELAAKQAENDAFREQNRAALPDTIKRAETAKAQNGSVHAAVAGKPSPLDAITAERDELQEENEALRNDVAELNRKLAAYDDRAVLWEKGGLDAIEANYKRQIHILEQRVEEATTDRATIIRQRDFWKKQAIALGYVSPNEQIEQPTEAAPF